MKRSLRRGLWRKHLPPFWVKYNLDDFPQMPVLSRIRIAIVKVQVKFIFSPYVIHISSGSCLLLISGIFLGKPGKKSFMYFASSAGRGFIISDDEEITGVISVKNKASKFCLRFKPRKLMTLWIAVDICYFRNRRNPDNHHSVKKSPTHFMIHWERRGDQDQKNQIRLIFCTWTSLTSRPMSPCTLQYLS